MPYIIEAWKEGDLWCAKTPDKDIFRHATLASAIGEIFTRVNAAIQYAPCHFMGVSLEETGTFMIENGTNHDVSIVYV